VCPHGEIDQPWFSEHAEVTLPIRCALGRIRRNNLQVMSSTEGNERIPRSSPGMHAAHDRPNARAAFEPIDAMIEIRNPKQQMIENIAHRNTGLPERKHRRASTDKGPPGDDVDHH